ncbi:helix-hairpin-helix domain-containing protein [Chitinophaga sp. OAE865]|uniref:ComEA family DNA-binding protein n=1 Tax=Chitinophaga sp. OAE865 TaxID=2817898 RepID=UPI001AE931DB
MWRSFAREYLRFSRKEQFGIITLAILMLITGYIPDLVFYFQRRVPATGSDDLKAAVLAFEAGMGTAEEEPVVLPPAHAGLCYFDPNTLPVAGWQQLGVSERTAATIRKYLASGGRFRKPADLGKIYGLPPALCTQLMPYVRIEGKEDTGVSGRYDRPDRYYAGHYGGGREDSSRRYSGDYSNNYQDSSHRYPRNDTISFTRYRKKAPAAPIDINLADSTAWQSLPGIGPGFARRIIAFRDRLGGFYSVEQVAECYGLPDSTFQKIQPFLQIGSSSLKKLDLNLTDEKSLAAHPYIRYKLARLIVQYRSSHAGFRAVSDLRNLPLVDEIIYRKIEHYIEIK